MRNPFRSEADAFRIVVMIVAAAGIVIASAVLISTTLGAILALIAILAGIWAPVGWLRVALSEREEEEEPGGAPPPDRVGDGGPEAPRS